MKDKSYREKIWDAKGDPKGGSDGLLPSTCFSCGKIKIKFIGFY